MLLRYKHGLFLFFLFFLYYIISVTLLLICLPGDIVVGLIDILTYPAVLCILILIDLPANEPLYHFVVT